MDTICSGAFFFTTSHFRELQRNPARLLHCNSLESQIHVTNNASSGNYDTQPTTCPTDAASRCGLAWWKRHVLNFAKPSGNIFEQKSMQGPVIFLNPAHGWVFLLCCGESGPWESHHAWLVLGYLNVIFKLCTLVCNFVTIIINERNTSFSEKKMTVDL